MQQGAGKNIPVDYPFVWGWKQNFRLVINHKNDDGSIRSEPLLTNVKLIIYNNKVSLKIEREFELTGNEGITFDNNAGTVTINVDANTPDILPVSQYFYMIEYHRTGLGVEQVFSGSFFVTVEGDCNANTLDYVTTNVEISQVNGLRDELDIAGNFQMAQTRRQTFDTNIYYAYIDVINGVDGLGVNDYKDGASFKTWRPALDWCNQWQGKVTGIRIEGTTISTPLIIDGGFGVSQKNRFSFANKTGQPSQYVTIQGGGSMQLYYTQATMSGINLTVNNNTAIGTVGHSSWDFIDTTITLGASCTQGCFYMIGDSDAIKFSENVLINFGANNQILFHLSGNGGTSNVVFSNHTTTFTINTGVYTGLRWAGNTPTRSLATWFVDSNAIIPSNVNMSDTSIWYGSSLSLRQTIFNLDCFNYPLNLGTTKPIRFTDLNSGSANGAYVTRKALYINELGEIIVG